MELINRKHDELNTKIWDDNKQMLPEVKAALLKVAHKFLKNLCDDGVFLKVKDIVVLGSNASYNYNETSDIDLHIIADLSDYGEYEGLAEKFCQAKKSIFNDKYDPMIRGVEVEIYVEPYQSVNADDVSELGDVI